MAIIAAVLLANGLYLTGLFDPNPLGPRSGLADGLALGPLRGQPTIDPIAGFISQALSHRAVHDLIHGHLPWWNPFEGTGAPLIGEMQSAALFPFTLLTFFSGGQIYEHVLLEILAGLSTYLLLRRLAVGRIAATAAGAAFALNGTFAWFAHSTVNPIAFLPLLLLGIELAHTRALEGRPGGWWVIALAGALSLYAGFPEVAYLDALLALAWLIWRCCATDRRHALRLLGKALAAGVAGTLLCAPLLIAMLDYFGHADLWLHVNGYFSHVALPTQAMPQLLMPYVFGPILGFSDPKLVVYADWVNVGGYLSSSLLILGLLGLGASGRRGLRAILAAWIILMLARMYDTPGFLADAVNALPGLSNAAVFRYSPPSIELAVVLLAAFGLDDVLRRVVSWRRLAIAATVAAASLAAAALAAHGLVRQLGPDFARRPYFALSLAGALLAAAACTAAAAPRLGHRIRLLAAAALVLEALLLFAAPELSAPRSVHVDTAPVAYLQQRLGTQRYFSLGPLAPNYGSYYALPSLNAVDVPVPKAFESYVHRRLDPAVDPTAFVGIVAGGRSLSAPTPVQELLSHLSGYREAAVAYVLAPAGQALPASPELALVRRTPTTWIYHLRGASPYMTVSGRGCTIAFGTSTAARSTCRSAGVLVRRETDMPGWSARVDGRAVPITAFDGAFQQIPVPAGTHRITFAYSPPNIGWGAFAFALGLLMFVAGIVSGRATRRPGRWRLSGSR